MKRIAPLQTIAFNIWRVKIQDREALYEEPHITIWRKANRYRYSLRHQIFLDPQPDPADVPQLLLNHVHQHWDELCRQWNDRFPANPVYETEEERALTTEVLERSPTSEAIGSMLPRWVSSNQDADKAARSEDRSIIWIVRNSRLAARIVRSVEWPGKRAGFLIVAGQPSPGVIPALLRRFERVAFTSDARGLLTKDELADVLTLPDRNDRFLGGIVDNESKTMTLWRGDLAPLIVRLSTFTPTANGIRPDFSKFSVRDYGHTLRVGDYEAAADAVLYDYDPDFRRALHQRRRATERTLGASIRRLRMQHQLTRKDFPEIDPKTLARIERNEITKPHATTLRSIASRLGVSVDDLGQF